MTSFICAATILINLSNEPWNDHDKKIEARAKYVCSTRYAPDNPCLKSLTKKPEQFYNALCGGETNE